MEDCGESGQDNIPFIDQKKRSKSCKNAGTQFDPTIVKIFVGQLLLQEGKGEIIG
ncbi:MAG: hypothetical protein ACOX3A_05765 [bacterium]|jgi:hypothetical protein